MLMVLFMRGAFSITDVEMASYSLMAYGSGLLSFMLIKVLAPGYYSRQDTKTPVRYGIIAMITNMGFNLLFAIPFGYVGLAIATSMSALLNATLLYRGLHLAGVYRISRPTIVFFVKAVVSTALMVVVLHYFLPSQSQWLEWHLIDRTKALIGLISMGGITYLLGLLLLGIRPWSIKRGV
jgi:putative peptidoglycan lipid II flippase